MQKNFGNIPTRIQIAYFAEDKLIDFFPFHYTKIYHLSMVHGKK